MSSPDAASAPQRDPWLLPALIACYVAALVPLWWPRFIPTYDMPQHLAGIALWSRIGDRSWGYQDFYALRLVPVPYWGYYFPTVLLSRIVPVEVASKLYLSLYAAALPASVVVLGRRFGRSPWLAVLAFPLIYNYSFGFGFVTFCAAVPMALFTLALLDRSLERASWPRLLALAIAALATFFTHVLPWLAMGVCAQVFLIVTALDSRRRRTAIASGVALLPSLIVAIWDFVFAARRQLFLMLPGPVLELDGTHDRPLDALWLLGHRLTMGWPGASDAVLLSLVILSAVALWRTAPALSSERRWRELVPALCLAVLASGYLFLPFHVWKPVNWWNASCRLLTPAALFALLSIRGAIAGRRLLLLVPGLVGALVFPLLLARHEVDAGRGFDGLVQLMEQVPRGASTLTLSIGTNSDPALDPEYEPFIHAHSYPQLLKGGFDAYQYRNGFPFVVTTASTPPVPPPSHPEHFEPAAVAHQFDYVLTRNEERDGQLFREYAAQVAQIGRVGEWRLYRTR